MSTVPQTVTIRDNDPATAIPLDEGQELVEAVVLDDEPGDTLSLQDEIDTSEDPRDAIARRHDEKYRDTSEISEESNDLQDKSLDNGEKVAETANSELVQIKVSGRIIEVEKERVDKAGGIEAYQKEVAVSQGFQDIAQQKKILKQEAADLEERKAAFEERIKIPSSPPDESAKSQKTDLPNLGDQSISDLVRLQREALVEGDDETADRIQIQLLGIRDSKDTQEPAQDIEIRAANRALGMMDERALKNSIRTAVSKFYIDNPEVNKKSDPRLFQMIDDETDLVEAEFPDYSPQQVLTKAYDRVKEWRGNKKPLSSLETKQSEKRSTIRPKTRTGRSEPIPEPREQTRSEWVTEQRKLRGLE